MAGIAGGGSMRAFQRVLELLVVSDIHG